MDMMMFPLEWLKYVRNQYSGTDPEILKTGGRSMSATIVGRQRKFEVYMVLKIKITLETITSWWKISLSIFMYNEGLPIKSYQFFNFTNVLIRKEKTLIHQSMRKEKLKKVGLCLFFNRFFDNGK